MTQQTPEGFLLGGGGRSAKFERVGDSITGTVATPPTLRQQTDIQTGKPVSWDNGDPKMVLVVQLQTSQRDDADDDGLRNLYLAGGFKRATLQKAVADAVRSSRSTGLDVGGTLTVQFTGEEPSDTKGFHPAKLYAAKYAPPSASFLSGPQDSAPADPWASKPF